MDEIHRLLHTMIARMESMELTIADLKSNQLPMTSTDYLSCLRTEIGVELTVFLDTIEITPEHVITLLKDKETDQIISSIDYTQNMRIFNNNNTIYTFREGKWHTMQKEELILVRKTIYTKTRETYRRMVKEKNSLLNDSNITELSYLEQRKIISELNVVKHPILKTKIYTIISVRTGQ